MPTARRSSQRASLYSSSVQTQMITSPVSAVEGSESALKPCRHDASSISRSTISPGSGMRGGLLISGMRLMWLDISPPRPTFGQGHSSRPQPGAYSTARWGGGMSVAPQLIEGGRDSRRASEPTSERTSYKRNCGQMPGRMRSITGQRPHSRKVALIRFGRPITKKPSPGSRIGPLLVPFAHDRSGHYARGGVIGESALDPQVEYIVRIRHFGHFGRRIQPRPPEDALPAPPVRVGALREG